MSSASVGLRERKKEATRRALHEAAVRLAVERGLEKLTVEAIADAVDVSRRTFSNYFSGKEEALLYSDRLRTRRLLELVDERPDGEAPWAALSAAALELAGDYRTDRRWAAEVRLLRRHPALAPQQVATYAEAERALAACILPRVPAGDGRELRARLLAAALLTTLRVCVQQWIEDPATALTDVVAQALAVVDIR